jgi:hypothetical protein
MANPTAIEFPRIIFLGTFRPGMKNRMRQAVKREAKERLEPTKRTPLRGGV